MRGSDGDHDPSPNRHRFVDGLEAFLLCGLTSPDRARGCAALPPGLGHERPRWRRRGGADCDRLLENGERLILAADASKAIGKVVERRGEFWRKSRALDLHQMPANRDGLFDGSRGFVLAAQVRQPVREIVEGSREGSLVCDLILRRRSAAERDALATELAPLRSSQSPLAETRDSGASGRARRRTILVARRRPSPPISTASSPASSASPCWPALDSRMERLVKVTARVGSKRVG